MYDKSTTKKITYGAYARKSSESEDRQVQSIRTQVDVIQDIQNRERLVFHEKPIEESQSAFLPGREGFDHLVELTMQGKVNAWICYHANRLSRNALDGGMIITLLDMGKLDHIRTPSYTYRNTPNDKMMLQFEFMLSKKSSDDKSEFVKDGLNKRYKKGLPTGKASIGFLNDKTKEKGDRDWLIDQPKLEKIEQILHRFLRGNDSIETIAQFAREELHLRTVTRKRQGGALVTRSGVEKILKNPVYAGFFYAKDRHSDGRVMRELDKKLPRLITKAQHKQIIEMLGGRCHQKKVRHSAIFSGYMIGSDGGYIGADHKFQLICDCKHKFAYRSKDSCPKCGTLISELKHPKYLSYIYYYNVKRSKSKLKTKRIEQSKVVRYITEYMQSGIFLSERIVKWSNLYVDALIDQKAIEQNKKQVTMDKELKRIDKSLDRLKTLYYNEAISIEEYKQEHEKLKEESAKLENLNIEFNQPLDLQLKNMLEEFGSVLTEDPIEEKKRLITATGSNLVWNEEKLSIIKPKWLNEFEKLRILMYQKYQGFEPENPIDIKGDLAPSEALCPSLLGYWDRVRTLFEEYKEEQRMKS